MPLALPYLRGLRTYLPRALFVTLCLTNTSTRWHSSLAHSLCLSRPHCLPAGRYSLVRPTKLVLYLSSLPTDCLALSLASTQCPHDHYISYRRRLADKRPSNTSPRRLSFCNTPTNPPGMGNVGAPGIEAWGGAVFQGAQAAPNGVNGNPQVPPQQPGMQPPAPGPEVPTADITTDPMRFLLESVIWIRNTLTKSRLSPGRCSKRSSTASKTSPQELTPTACVVDMTRCYASVLC
ncbi:hypothetical protein BC628DRAFT_634947 [Trametes gibbosa]|nr:hypothetical protein BC628DRAFT_634947 [Trametes gibbosa]